MPPRIVVIGGGLAGLVAARDVALTRPDAEVLLLEGTDRLGGKLRLESVAGSLVDVGAEAMLARRPEGLELVRELGAADELVSPSTTAASIWSRGALHPVPRATLMGVPSSLDGLEGLLTGEEQERVAAEEAWPGGVVDVDVSVGEYIGARLGRAVVDRLIDPLLGGVYAGHADQLSLAATMPAVWAAARTGESLAEVARRSVSPAHTADGSARPVFGGIRGGMGRLPELLVAALPDNVIVRTSTLVRGIEQISRAGGVGPLDHPGPATGGASGAQFPAYRVLAGPTIAEVHIDSDAVIVATPARAASRLLDRVAPGAADALAEIPAASSVVVTMAFLAAHMPDLPGSGFLVPAVDGHLVKGATFSGNKWAWTAELDPDIVFVRASIGRVGEESLLQRTDDVLLQQCVAELGEALGAPLPAPLDSHVQRWGGGLPQYTVGHLDRMRRVMDSIATVPGVEVAGAAYDGVGIPAVIGTARSAAKAVTAYLSSAAKAVAAQ